MTSPDLEHEETAALLGAFVLHGVDPEEEARVERHLETCPRCRNEVDELLYVAAALGGASEIPPPAVWDGIAEHLSERADDVPVSGASRGAIAPLPSLLPDDRKPPAAPTKTRLQQWKGRSNRRLVAVGLAAAAATAAIVVLSLSLANANSQGARTRLALASATEIRAALSSAGNHIVELRSDSGARQAEMVVARDGEGYVVNSRMSALPADETYQLWASIAGRPISLGLLGDRLQKGAGFNLGSSRSGAKELMITIEPAGGVVAPSQSPVATGGIPS